MPNRNENDIVITGPADDVLRIKKYIKKESFFNNFCKRPKSAEKDWHNWNCNNRWTKRDVWKKSMAVCEYTENDNRWCLELAFDTARSPPYEAMYYLAIHNPKITIHLRYSEWWMNFSWEAQRSEWEKEYHEQYDDYCFGQGKLCVMCNSMYNNDNPDDRFDEEHTTCLRCWNVQERARS